MITKEKLQKYIDEYNRTHEGKCIPTWEEKSFYVEIYNDKGHIGHYYFRKFRTKQQAEQYIEERPWEGTLTGRTIAKIVSYDYLIRNKFEIPQKYYTIYKEK